jgi:hypothetical protein
MQVIPYRLYVDQPLSASPGRGRDRRTRPQTRSLGQGLSKLSEHVGHDWRAPIRNAPSVGPGDSSNVRTADTDMANEQKRKVEKGEKN